MVPPSRASRLPRALTLAALLACLAGSPAAVGDDAGHDIRHVVVVVVDGLKPSEVDATVPTLQGLRERGTWYEQSRSVLVAETIPNHVAMMTGVLSERSGIVANSIVTAADQDEGVDADDPALFGSGIETLQTTIERRCPQVQTATILSKQYLYDVFSSGGAQRQADVHWEPTPQIPESDHAPDVATTEQVLAWIAGLDSDQPSLTFVNLGDVDRMGHVDMTGGLTAGAVAAQRRAVLADTDVQVGRIVSAIDDAGIWGETVMIVASDHGMDWSQPHQFVETPKILEEAGLVAGPAGVGDFVVAHNGGADLIYVHDDALVPVAVDALEAADAPGIARVVSGQGLAALGIGHGHVGDIVVFAEPGWRMADATGKENAIPGNHGHGVTQHNTLLVAGGHASIASESVPGPNGDLLINPAGRAGNLSIAPTVAAVLGLDSPNAPFDAPALDEAFVGGVVPRGSACGAGRSAVATSTTHPGASQDGARAAGVANGSGPTPATGAPLFGGLATAILAAGAGARRLLRRSS